MPHSIKHLWNVGEDRSCVTASIHVVGDVLGNTTKLVDAAVPPTEVMLKIREKIISFSKLLQSSEHKFCSNLTERWRKANLLIAGERVWFPAFLIQISVANFQERGNVAVS